MDRSRILVVDDDPLIRGSLYEMLRGRRFDVEMASDGAEAMEHLQRRTFHLVITDWKMPQVDGVSLLNHIKSKYPEVNVVLITGFGNINSAVEAIRQGAFDYLTKPIQPEELEATIQRALSEYIAPPETIDDPFAGVIGQHPTMQKLFAMIQSVAASPATVLLEGESGTGKRVIAQAIHRADAKRRSHPFVEISCGALPETLLESELFGHIRGSFTGAIRDKQGRFELADGGTILLDEIDAFSSALQVKLLRVIQERLYERVGDTRTMRVDVRIIAATNRRLLDLVKQGKFREDLYYRLNVIPMRLPSLRERRSDLPLLVDHFIARSSRAMGKTISGVTDEAMNVFMEYQWPGNIRQLENVLERAVILAKRARLDVDDLPEELRFRSDATSMAIDDQEEGAKEAEGAFSKDDSVQLKDALKMPERELILKVLAEVRWNRSEAAKRLGIHRSTLYHKIRQLGIQTSSS
ncbi:MAG: sigma-54-dependent Fis family transcriptional regulator [Candidatus Omnitrophica bacterium]|nr:sigma-54-dependent Fis family transcriptional regulator [Candidatus Omnitrophota bacterium]